MSPKIISGAEPAGDVAFARMAAMGVKTLISVDGQSPDQERAARHGMRYVHLPIQYRGLTDEQVLRLTKAFRELPAPFYVHCFHGKHRGPAAAALGRLVLDGVSRERALAEMRFWCGTSEKYDGLYATIADRELPSPERTRAHAWDFPAVQDLADFRQQMVEVTRAYDHLKALAERGWKADPAHPDVDARNEASKLHELFLRDEALPEVRRSPGSFRRWMKESTEISRRLRDRLERPGDGVVLARESLSSLGQLCSRCHRSYRNR